VDRKVPQEVSDCGHQHRHLEYLDDHAVELWSHVDRVGKPAEEVVFVHPVLDEEDEDEDGGRGWSQDAVEGHHEGEDDIEGVHDCEVELGLLQGLVELELEQVDGFVGAVSDAVDAVVDELDGDKDLHGHTDKTRYDDQTCHLAHQPEISQRALGVDQVQNRVNEGGVYGLGDDVLYQQGSQPIGLCDVFLQLRKDLNRVAQDVVDYVGQHGHRGHDQGAQDEFLEAGPSRVLFLPVPPKFNPQQRGKGQHKQHEQHN
jgi:hypothetical protein